MGVVELVCCLAADALLVLYHILLNTRNDHLNNEDQCFCGSSLDAKKNVLHFLLQVCVDACLPVYLCVHQEVDCCGGGGGGGVRGCRAPNEGVRNKISAPGSSSAHRLPQTPSD